MLDMFDNVQQILQTKITMGYDRSKNDTAYFYDLKFTPDNWSVYRRYPTLRIPMDIVQHNVKTNCALTKRNIESLTIPDAFGCFIGVGVMNDIRYRNEVTARVDGLVQLIAARTPVENDLKIQDRALKSNKVWLGMFTRAVEKELNAGQVYWKD
jgi:hypothetical protein